MKKILTMLSIAFFVFMVGAASAAPMKVTVDKVQGTVQVSKGSGWAALKNGDTVPVGADVKTGAGSSCILKWAGGNVIKITPMSTVSVSAERTAAGDEKSSVNLKQGKVNAHAKKLSTAGSSFNVKTPTAVAGVRGTDILAEIQAGNVSFAVSDGQLELTIGEEVFMLDDGFLVSVDPDGAFSEPVPIPQEMLEELKSEFEALKLEADSGEDMDASGTESKDEAEIPHEDVSGSIDGILDDVVNNAVVESAQPVITGDVEIIIYLDNQR
jgi:hypothetical protein